MEEEGRGEHIVPTRTRSDEGDWRTMLGVYCTLDPSSSIVR